MCVCGGVGGGGGGACMRVCAQPEIFYVVHTYFLFFSYNNRLLMFACL